MKQVLLFGAGKSATVLIDYLLANASEGKWKLQVVDADLRLAESKINGSGYGVADSFDIRDDDRRAQAVQNADLVISMLPPALHFLVAKDCCRFSRHLLTASYVDEQVRELQQEIDGKDILFLCEMGLDPGIDHMSAMRIIDDIHARGGTITSFKSHCGGLVAPESDDNPWHYKISWNPRNIVLAGKAGAHYIENGKEVRLEYKDLFTTDRMVTIPGIGHMSWYPNRDSLSYTALYGLQDAATFIRTTLRHPDFMFGWKNILELNLTSEEVVYDATAKSLAAAFKMHLDTQDFNGWLKQKMTDRFKDSKDMLANLTRLMEAEKEVQQDGDEIPGTFMSADAKGNLEEIQIDEVKTKAAAFVAHKMREASLTLRQLVFLGLDDEKTMVDKGKVSAADILQFALEKKLGLSADDRDMVIMMHEFGYRIDGRDEAIKSYLVDRGVDGLRTAMARTVGLPLGIAARQLLNGDITLRGLHIPTCKEIYEPVLRELENAGIRFTEE